MVHSPRQAAFTTTKVPRFGGTTIWEQYRHVFDAIALSNGWDDATAALLLLSYLVRDALNVALLVPMSRRTSRACLVDALSAHMGCRADWWIIEGSLRKQLGRRGRSLHICHSPSNTGC